MHQHRRWVRARAGGRDQRAGERCIGDGKTDWRFVVANGPGQDVAADAQRGSAVRRVEKQLDGRAILAHQTALIEGIRTHDLVAGLEEAHRLAEILLGNLGQEYGPVLGVVPAAPLIQADRLEWGDTTQRSRGFIGGNLDELAIGNLDPIPPGPGAAFAGACADRGRLSKPHRTRAVHNGLVSIVGLA